VRDEDTSEGILADVPAVVIDRALPGFDTVLADYAEGGRLAARHLLEQGHRRIGVVSGPDDISSMRERCDGAARLIDAEGELAFRVTNAFSIDLEPDVIDALDRSGVTAVFAGADIIAMGIIRHLAASGRAVPGAVSVIGFDDIPWAEVAEPALSTVEMPLHAMAAEAVETVLRKMDRGDAARRSIVFNTSLISRRSVARADAA
jgi:LacI family transcriptional regulator